MNIRDVILKSHGMILIAIFWFHVKLFCEIVIIINNNAKDAPMLLFRLLNVTLSTRFVTSLSEF